MSSNQLSSDMESSIFSTALQSFTQFPKLPTEVRLRIWAFAATPRPRVIQIFYDREKDSWHAWKDGRGGLPTVALTSREAYSEAMKPYTIVFDTLFQMEIDTLFISDPLFTLRKPMNAFMRSRYASKFNRIAITSNQYWGLAETHTFYPQLCPSPGAILRDLKGLKTFTLVLSEDGAGDLIYSDGSEDDDDEEDSSEEIEDIEDNEEVDYGEEIEDIEGQAGESDSGTATSLDVPVIYGSDYQSTSFSNDDLNPLSTAIGDENDEEISRAAMRRILDRGEREAMEYLSKGYFRHVGNIYLQSAMASSEYWDHWDSLKEELGKMCNIEKKSFPDWTRPNVSFMIVRYGLRPWKDCYDEKVHVRGDHDNGILERESPEYKRWVRSIYGDEDF